MYIKTVLLCSVIAFPTVSLAERGSFEFSTNGKQYVFDPSSIKSIEYTQQKSPAEDRLGFQFSDTGAEKLKRLTHENMGKKLTIAYKGNPISTAYILQNLKYGMQISTKDTPRIVLKQILNDYGVANE